MMNLDILESDKAQSVPKLVSALWLCVTNGEAAAAACDIVSRDPDRDCVWHSPRCDVKMCDVAAPPSPVFSTQFTLPPQMGEYDTVGALVQVPLQLVHWGHLQGDDGTAGDSFGDSLKSRSCIEWMLNDINDDERRRHHNVRHYNREYLVDKYHIYCLPNLLELLGLCWVVGYVRPNRQGAVSRVCDPDKWCTNMVPGNPRSGVFSTQQHL